MSKPLVSSLSMAFKRATTITEDVDEAKREHRQNLKNLIDKYQEDVVAGKAEGIRTAKELVEVIKLDLLLMGEATERTGAENPVNEVQVTKMMQALDENSPEVQALLGNIFEALNGANDDMDTTPVTTGMKPVSIGEQSESPKQNIEGVDNDESKVQD